MRASTRQLACLLACVVLTLGIDGGAAHAMTPAFQGVTVAVYYNESAADIDHDLAIAQSLGSNLVRLDVWWSSLEPTAKGQYSSWYQALLDTAIRGAQARGMKVLAIVQRSPCWASSAPPSVKGGCPASGGNGAYSTYPPLRASDYAAAVGYVARRYASALAGIEIWNEPNMQGFFTTPNAPAAYAALLRAAYPAVHAVDPQVRVVAGALSLSDTAFLKQLYANGIRGYYDAFSVHPYSGDQSPDAPPPAGAPAASFRQSLLALRSTMLANQDSAPVWATEFGWNTGPIRNYSFYANGVDEPTQAAYLARAINLLHDPSSGLAFVQAAAIFQLRDYSSPYFSESFGLVRQDFSPKPSMSAVAAAFIAP